MTNETIATETTEAVGEFPIDELLSDGITNTPPSFVRAILKAASDPEVTSFAGGLPNPISFPQEKLLESMQRVVAERGPEAFQYSVTAGVPELRAWIADRYNHRFGTDYTEEDVLVTTGSQQVLDLLGKVLLDKGDGVIVEKPTYLAAIQAFALQQPVFREVELTEEGLNIDELNAALDAGAKMIYELPEPHGPYLHRREPREGARGAGKPQHRGSGGRPLWRASLRRRVAALHRWHGAAAWRGHGIVLEDGHAGLPYGIPPHEGPRPAARP